MFSDAVSTETLKEGKMRRFRTVIIKSVCISCKSSSYYCGPNLGKERRWP